MPSDSTRHRSSPFVKIVGALLLFVLIAGAVLAVGPTLTSAGAPPSSLGCLDVCESTP